VIPTGPSLRYQGVMLQAEPMSGVMPPSRRDSSLVRDLAVGLLATAVLFGALPGRADDSGHLQRLLEKRSCPGCRLADADLVYADLRDARLEQAQLQRANLGRAQLDGADLRGADLSFSSLLGASLRGADLRGARLEGTDLREADLSGARLDPNALARSHWKGAIGVPAESSSYASIHNAGVEAALEGRLPQAEEAFSKALLRQPDAAITWVARGLVRIEQGNRDGGRKDLDHAASLYELQGSADVAAELRQGAEQLAVDPEAGIEAKGGNGMGSAMLQGAAGLVQALAPLAQLASRFIVPLPF
jgi:uncharacterized protein YjbI with pentapeptide repeats